MTIRFTVGTTPDDRYAIFDIGTGAEVCRFDDDRSPGEAEPNRSRAEAFLDALRLAELIADDDASELPIRRAAASDILRRSGAR